MVNSNKIEKKKAKADSSIYLVKYLPRAHMIAMLDENKLQILSRELELSQELTTKNKKEKIHLFCLNMAVYRAENQSKNVGATDQICVATVDKNLYFFETIMT